MATKASVQATQATVEAKLVLLQKQSDPRTSNGPDSRATELAALATALAANRAEIDALP